MKTTSARRLVALQLDAFDSAPVAFFEGEEGEGLALTGEQAANDELALPRWLVRQVGFVEGAGNAVQQCCADCKEIVLRDLENKVRSWYSRTPDSGSGP